MSFDIKKHVLDHAFCVINNLEKNRGGKLVHFNTSTDIAYFIFNGYSTQEEIDQVMITLLDELARKELLVHEKNGTSTNKKGVKKQKYRQRKIIFTELLMAYHKRHLDGSKSVNPHFHFLMHPTIRMGKRFRYLRRALKEEADKYNIKFNFMEERQETGLSSTKLKNLKRLSWIFHQGDLDEIYNFVTNNKDALTRNIDSLVTHYQYTQNISFFLKILLIINQRLNELNLDYMYGDMNLKENIFFFLAHSHIESIEILKQSNSTIKINIDNVLDREILKFAYGFETEVMNVLVDKFGIKRIKKEQLDVEENITNNDTKEKDFIGFRDLVVMDIRNAMTIAKSEKEFKSILTDMKYDNVTTKSSQSKAGKRTKIGFNITTEKKTKMFIRFHELQLTWSKMLMIFDHNSKKEKKSKKLESNLDKYEKKSQKIDEDLIKFEYRVPKLLQLYCKKDSHDIKIEKFDDYHLERSDMYNITSLKNNDNSIVITEDRITLKKSSGEEKAIQDMLKLAELKGWDLNHLVVSGEEALAEKVKVEILLGTKPKTLEKKDKVIPVVKRSL